MRCLSVIVAVAMQFSASHCVCVLAAHCTLYDRPAVSFSARERAMKVVTFTPHPPTGERSIAMSAVCLCVCVSVCLCVHDHIHGRMGLLFGRLK